MLGRNYNIRYKTKLYDYEHRLRDVIYRIVIIITCLCYLLISDDWNVKEIFCQIPDVKIVICYSSTLPLLSQIRCTNQ